MINLFPEFNPLVSESLSATSAYVETFLIILVLFNDFSTTIGYGFLDFQEDSRNSLSSLSRKQDSLAFRKYSFFFPCDYLCLHELFHSLSFRNLVQKYITKYFIPYLIISELSISN